MAVDDALRVAGGAAGVTHCGSGLFVEVRPVELVRPVGQQVVVAHHGLARFFQRVDVAVADRDHGVHRLEVGSIGASTLASDISTSTTWSSASLAT